ncbi:MAG: proliferating cell nuclear antigen (pcna) [Nitrososphaerales archaeon]
MPAESATKISESSVFVARTETPSEWRAVTASIQTLVEEATFDVSSEGITFRAMDPSHVALVDLFWPSSAFEKFECSKTDKFTVRVEDFTKLIRRAESKDAVEISRHGQDSLVLKLGSKREFELHLVESSQSSTPLPKLNFNSKFTIIEPAFDRVLNDISVVSNHITIEAKKDALLFSGKGDTGKASVTLEKAGQDIPELDVKEESKATYSIEYLLKITKAAGSASDMINFEYSSKMPLRMEFKLGENSKGGRIHFYLAPRVQE